MLLSRVGFIGWAPGAKVIKNFTTVICKWIKLARVFVPGRHFKLSLLFVSKTGAYLSRPRFSYYQPGQAPGLIRKNIRLGWKGLPGTNTSLFDQFVKFCYLLGKIQFLWLLFEGRGFFSKSSPKKMLAFWATFTSENLLVFT